MKTNQADCKQNMSFASFCTSKSQNSLVELDIWADLKVRKACVYLFHSVNIQLEVDHKWNWLLVYNFSPGRNIWKEVDVCILQRKILNHCDLQTAVRSSFSSGRTAASAASRLPSSFPLWQILMFWTLIKRDFIEPRASSSAPSIRPNVPLVNTK